VYWAVGSCPSGLGVRKDRRRGEAQGDREYFLGSELGKPKRELSERCENGAGLGRMCF
jgi:hypothetical protein